MERDASRGRCGRKRDIADSSLAKALFLFAFSPNAWRIAVRSPGVPCARHNVVNTRYAANGRCRYFFSAVAALTSVRRATLLFFDCWPSQEDAFSACMPAGAFLRGL